MECVGMAVNQTKVKIATALIELVKTTDYSKISVQMIAKKAEINRQTFYYHFADKDELLRYIYYTEALNFLTSDELSLANWEEQVLQMLRAIYQHRDFYRKTVADRKEILIREFSKIVGRLFRKLFEDFDTENYLSESDKDFYGHFFTYGCSGVLLAWIEDDYPVPPLEVATQMFRLAKDVEFYSYRLYQQEEQ
ncbi:hypothetical protein RV01_GL002413 [Enterococcus dispar]|nr:hypothetical protein RV01_GL002413 [Enterococcus dispar]